MAVDKQSAIMNKAQAAELCALASATAESVEKPPRNPTPQNGPGLKYPMAKQAARFTAKVTDIASISGVVGFSQNRSRKRASAPSPDPNATIRPVRRESAFT